MMKKLLIIITVFAMLLSLFACTPENDSKGNENGDNTSQGSNSENGDNGDGKDNGENNVTVNEDGSIDLPIHKFD